MCLSGVKSRCLCLAGLDVHVLYMGLLLLLRFAWCSGIWSGRGLMALLGQDLIISLIPEATRMDLSKTY